MRLLRTADGDRLVQPASGRDLSADMHSFSRGFLAGLGEVDGFLLKSQSPTCGIGNVKHYATSDGGAAVGRTQGMFAAAVLARFPDLPVEDEGRMQDAALRRHFLTRLFTLHRFRTLAGGRPTRGDLVQFHAAHKWLLLGYNQSRMREMGRLLAAPGAAADTTRRYGEMLATALARRPSLRSQLNVLHHGLGYVGDGLNKAEKRHFLTLADAFGEGGDLRPAQELLRSWLLRFEQAWALDQRWFDPFPAALMTA